MDDFTDDSVFGGSLDADEIREADRDLHFEAWHRPRKHWIRSRQWWGAIDGLRRMPEHRKKECLNILTLPGGELLDIRYFNSKISRPEDDAEGAKKLRLVGFVSDRKDYEQAQRNLPLIGIKDSISTDSIIRRGNIDEFAEGNMLESTFKKMGPFEVINLDYCQSIAPPNNRQRIESVGRMLSHQLDYQTKPWLLMFTTRTAKGALDAEFLETIYGIVDNNIKESGHFLDSFLNDFEALTSICDDDGISYFALDRAAIGDGFHSEMFIIGFLKWVLSFAHKASNKVKLESVVRYDIDGDEEENDMFSVVLSIKKVGVTALDPRNIVKIPAANEELEAEGVLASRFVPKVKATKTVESIIFRDIDTYSELSNELADFLAQCGKCIDTFWGEVCKPEVEENGWDLDEVRA